MRWRAWFADIAAVVHDADYRQSQKDFNSFVESLTEKIIEKDETIPELPSKDLVSSFLSTCAEFKRILTDIPWRLSVYIGTYDSAQIQHLIRLA